ncbi:MAG: efflux RND transporter periplasmic adaptor subunit [Opitutales bacterium]|nr:efflux RND transporter periplasmic adaptor subunit [Opitutales bacterium]
MKWLAWFIPLALVLGIGYWFFFMRAMPVPVVEARVGEATSAVTGTIEVLATRDQTLKTETGGRVAEIPFDLGEPVEEGTLLVRFDASRFENEREQMRVRLNAAREAAEWPLPNELDLKSLEDREAALRLRVERGAAPRSELDRLHQEMDKLRLYRDRERLQQRESIALMELQLEALERRIGEAELRSPFAGRVVELFAQTGDLLHGNADVVRVVSDEWFLDMTLSEEDFAGVALGQPVVARLASFGGREIRGKVDHISTVVDAERKTRSLMVSLDEIPEGMALGQTGEAYLVRDQRSGNVVIPRRALLGRQVYVLENGQVRIRSVEPGYLSLNRAEILSGLEPGDRVIVDRQSDLREGDRVRPITIQSN